MHQISESVHNLKKFFAIPGRKYTGLVHKELLVNILLIKKRNPGLLAKNTPIR